jgi:hypothetical protein
VLLVEPDTQRRRLFPASLAAIARVGAQADSVTARHSLLTTDDDLVVANRRLEAYNRLHLVASPGDTDTPSALYASSVLDGGVRRSFVAAGGAWPGLVT